MRKRTEIGRIGTELFVDVRLIPPPHALEVDLIPRLLHPPGFAAMIDRMEKRLHLGERIGLVLFPARLS